MKNPYLAELAVGAVYVALGLTAFILLVPTLVGTIQEFAVSSESAMAWWLAATATSLVVLVVAGISGALMIRRSPPSWARPCPAEPVWRRES